VFCDFETVNRSGCDLLAAGGWRYASDPATEVLCFGYRARGEDNTWTPDMGLTGPLASLAAAETYYVSFAGLEPIVWQLIMVDRHGFPPIPAERWIDLRAVCSYLALPRKLEKVLPILGLPVVKDVAGQRLVRRLSKLDRNGAYPEITPEVLQRVIPYNRTDVHAVDTLYEVAGTLPDDERRVWLLDQRINARGIWIDTDFVSAAKAIADASTGEVLEEFDQLTGGDGLSPHKVAKMRGWLAGRGLALPNLQADTVEEALQSIGLPDDVRRALEIRQIVAATSLKKLDAMLACVGPDGRARGLLQYHAARTGRWSGQLIQPQNLPRPTVDVASDDIEPLVDAVKTRSPDALRHWGKPTDVLVTALRYAIAAAEGSLLGAGDFAMIEVCVLLALAGQLDKCALITSGLDVHRDMAARIYGLDRDAFLAIDKKALTAEQTEQRLVGKNGVLSCGYQVSAETFWRRYCRHLGEEGKELAVKIVGVYRHQWAPKVPALWRDLEKTARSAMTRPGKIQVANCGVAYWLTTRAGLPCLICELLNGKLLHYFNARTVGWDHYGRAKWTYWAYRNGQWREVEPYGGQLTENTVSAMARELLVDRMFGFEEAGYPIVFSVHDEIVVEHPEITRPTMEEIMASRPGWAEKLGVPVAVEAWTGRRYRK
jgi:DNA polymerase